MSELKNSYKIIEIDDPSGHDLDVYFIPVGTECTKTQIKMLNAWREVNEDNMGSVDNSMNDDERVKNMDSFLLKMKDNKCKLNDHQADITIVFARFNCHY